MIYLLGIQIYMHLTYRYILLEIIRYTLFSNTRLLQFNSIPTYLKFQSYSYIFYSFSLFRRCLSFFFLGSLHPPSVLLRSFPVVSRGHSRSLIQGKNTFFFSCLGKRGSTEKEKKRRNILARRKSVISREKEGMEAFVSVIEKRKYPPTFPAYRRSTCSLP